MSEEEKEAIISLKKYLDFRKESEYYGNDYEVEILINLVDKQQKEIEKLKKERTAYKEYIIEEQREKIVNAENELKNVVPRC